MSTNHLEALHHYVHYIQQQIGSTAAAVYIIQNNKVIDQWYSGRHGSSVSSRPVDEHSQFNVGSIRKTYLGLAISILIEENVIHSMDDEIFKYMKELDKDIVTGTTIRHLLTHTHGLKIIDNKLNREYKAGQGWKYTNAGINILINLVVLLTGKALSEFMNERVFIPFNFNETGWKTKYQEQLVYNVYDDPHSWVGPNWSSAGDQSNLFVSARELALWGCLHLNKGYLEGKQVLSMDIVERVVTLQSPITMPNHLPKNGIIWWMQANYRENQLGEHLPNGSYQILGITGCTCLVIPEYNAVAVRMYNQLHNSEGYDYLADIRQFGNQVSDILRINV